MYWGLREENDADLSITRLNAYRSHFNLSSMITAEEVFLMPESYKLEPESEESFETEALEEETINEVTEVGLEDCVYEEEVYINDEEQLDENIIYIAQEAEPNALNQKTEEERFFYFGCHLCDHEEFPKFKLLAQHCKISHSSMPKVKCCFDACDSVLSTWRRLIIHKEKHFPSSDRLRCSTCQKPYSSVTALQNHIESHNNQFICTHCGKAFRESKTLKIHEQTHLKPLDERKKQLCPFPNCGLKFITKQACQNHVGMKHQKSVVCCCKEENCGKSFYTRKSYYEHLRNAHGERKYFCDQCDFKARTRQAINVHREVHIEGRVFSCDLCSATFSIHRRLKHHMSKHLKESLRNNFINASYI